MKPQLPETPRTSASILPSDQLTLRRIAAHQNEKIYETLHRLVADEAKRLHISRKNKVQS